MTKNAKRFKAFPGGGCNPEKSPFWISVILKQRQQKKIGFLVAILTAELQLRGILSLRL